MDHDAWEERSAIMEYDGGMSRFEAETRAAREQGKQRWEMVGSAARRVVESVAAKRGGTNENGIGNSQKHGRPEPSLAGQSRKVPVPGMQPASPQEDGSLPERDANAGGNSGVLPSLRLDIRGGI